MNDTIPENIKLHEQATQIDQCVFVDRPSLHKQLATIKKRMAAGKEADRAIDKLARSVSASLQLKAMREALSCKPEYPDALPVSQKRDEIAAASGVDGGRILKFVNHADLMRVKGVGGEYAELLEASGVDTIKELRSRNAENLAKAIQAINEERRLARATPSVSMVSPI